SLAIVLAEADLYKRSFIYGTDVNSNVLETAKKAIYPLNGSRFTAKTITQLAHAIACQTTIRPCTTQPSSVPISGRTYCSPNTTWPQTTFLTSFNLSLAGTFSSTST